MSFPQTGHIEKKHGGEADELNLGSIGFEGYLVHLRVVSQVVEYRVLGLGKRLGLETQTRALRPSRESAQSEERSRRQGEH